MRAVVQRVGPARVEVENEVTGAIQGGLLVYLGAGKQDTQDTVQWMARKIATLRIFEDANEKMNLSVQDIAGEVLVVSQFTLYGDVRQGRRPGFEGAAAPEVARELYEQVCKALQDLGLRVATGRFRASMAVHAEVRGPVTILIDSERAF